MVSLENGTISLNDLFYKCSDDDIKRNIERHIERYGKSSLSRFFNKACLYNKLDIMKYVYSLIEPGLLEKQILYEEKHIPYDHSDHPFVLVCYTQIDIECVKWMIDNTTFDINIGNGFAFYKIAASYNGNLDLLKLLYATGKFDVNSYGYPRGRWIVDHEHIYPNKPSAPFRAACVYNNIEIVKWLYSLGTVNIKDAICTEQVEDWLDPECTYIYMKPIIEFLKTLPELADSPIQNVIEYNTD